MHQQPPKTPLLRSTTSAKASQVEASSGRARYAICSVIDSSIEAARLATGPDLPRRQSRLPQWNKFLIARDATAGRALDAVAASRTIGSEEDGRPDPAS